MSNINGIELSLVLNIKLSGEDYDRIISYLLYKGILGQESDYNKVIGRFFTDNISEYVDGMLIAIAENEKNRVK